MAHLLQVADRLAPDALRRRVRRDQLGMLGLDRAQLVEQLVVLVVADLRIVEDVVAVAVVVELRGAARRRARPRARAVWPALAVRSLIHLASDASLRDLGHASAP